MANCQLILHQYLSITLSQPSWILGYIVGAAQLNNRSSAVC